MKTNKMTSFTEVTEKTNLIDKIQRLRPIDDGFFEKLCEDKEVCQEIIRTILNDDSITVTSTIPQKSIKNLQGRSVRVDALCTQGDGSYCNVEVQRADNDNHFRRVRYNASCITANVTDPGIKFEKVPDLYVIYISEFDILNAGMTIYHQKTIVEETGVAIEDGLHVVYVNTVVNDGSVVAELMQCFLQTHPNNGKFPKLAERVNYFKTNKEGVRSMCKIMEEVKNDGVKEGKIEMSIEMAVKMFKDGLSFGTVKRYTSNLLDEELQKIYEDVKAGRL